MTYRIIDVDTHITEPADVWTSRVAQKFADRVPRVERIDGRDVWLLDGERFGAVGPTAPAGWNKPMPDMPTGYDDIHRASFDSTARLELMDKRGVWAEVLYPNVAGFGGQKFLTLNDRELMYECVRAYNDFQTDWCSVDSPAHPDDGDAVLGRRRVCPRDRALRRQGLPRHQLHR